MATSASPNAAPSRKNTYTIDLRIFLAMTTIVMALAFGAGVIFGPTPSALHTLSRPAELTPLPPGHISESREVTQTRRLPTAHSAELGVKVKSDSKKCINEHHVNVEQPSYEDLEGSIRRESGNLTFSSVNSGGKEEEEHFPAGQHLLVDIKNVEAALLNSEERLAFAMVEVVRGAGLTLLSYHCHTLQPAGVSCIGVLLESHISFHTWPAEGVITLDLFTCGAKPLLPVVAELERLFGIPRINATTGEKEEIVTRWSHELRGFRNKEVGKKHHLDDRSDLAFWVVSKLNVPYKKEIVSVQSPYQRIDIWDLKTEDDTPTHADGIKYGLKAGDPRWLTDELATPERMLFLDGKLQSMSYSEHEYHEALVQPTMFAHPNPTHVAIVGGGEGATLREVLKHKTVQTVTMIEIDELMIEIAREHLPFMNNCSDLRGSADICFEDDRATIVHEDARTWFVDRYGQPATKSPLANKFDVIIMDALDPENDAEISYALYGEMNFVTSLYNSLSDLGVIAVQVGAAPSIHDPKADMGVHARRELLINLLENHPSTAAMFVYEEARCGFQEPHSFLVACKSADCRRRWYAESDSIDFQIYKRIKQTVSGESALVHFDGSTQRSFQLPPKAWETVYCRREPTPFECAFRGLDLSKKIFKFDIEDAEKSDFMIKALVNEDGEEDTAVYAIKDIPKGSYIMPDDLAASFMIRDESLSNLKFNTEIPGTGKMVVIENFLQYIEDHGHRSLADDNGKTYVEVGGTFMMRRTRDEDKVNVGRWMPPHPSGKIPIYSPVYERYMMSFDLFLVATKSIKKGEELFKHEDVWG